jgi:hypothetical protein
MALTRQDQDLNHLGGYLTDILDPWKSGHNLETLVQPTYYSLGSWIYMRICYEYVAAWPLDRMRR